jgi:hypothetical protein
VRRERRAACKAEFTGAPSSPCTSWRNACSFSSLGSFAASASAINCRSRFLSSETNSSRYVPVGRFLGQCSSEDQLRQDEQVRLKPEI